MRRSLKVVRAGATIAASVAVSSLLLGSVGCWPFSQDDSSSTSPPADVATPDIQSTIDAAVSGVEQPTHGPAPGSTPDVPSTIESLAPTLEAMVQAAVAKSLTPSPSSLPNGDSGAGMVIATEPSPTATLPFSPIIPRPTEITPTFEPGSSVDGENVRPDAPGFFTQTLDGSDFFLDQYRGNPTLVVIWAPW